MPRLNWRRPVEQLGWKGRRLDGVGVHPRQAIVLVNNRRQAGAQFLALSETIQQDMAASFGVTLEIEPRVV